MTRLDDEVARDHEIDWAEEDASHGDVDPYARGEDEADDEEGAA